MQGSWDDIQEQRIVVPFPVEAPLSGEMQTACPQHINGLDTSFPAGIICPGTLQLTLAIVCWSRVLERQPV